MEIDYLWGEDSRVHAINCKKNAAELQVGALCLVSFPGDTARICNEHHIFIVAVPKEFRSSSEKVKAFNVVLDILSHEQV
jgi:hypothetical protein